MKYENMLDKLYENLPKKKKGTERFEMPILISFIHGKQTIIKNIHEAASKLRRDPQHLLKYIMKDLGTSGNLEANRSIMQGKFKDSLINSRLKNYIEEYVICKECGKPDTELITFEGMKYKRCEVCSARAPVKAI